MNRKVHVLIVEDEPIVALDLATGLEHAGFEVAGVAGDAVEARRLFVDHDVDILLMDIQLNGEKDGIDTVRELMGIRRTPVIYLTAFTDAATVRRVKETYPAAFLVKPYHISNVLIAVELALEGFAKQQELAAEGGGDRSRTSDGDGGGREQLLLWKDQVFVKLNNRYMKVGLSSILYLAAESNYVHLVTTEGRYPLRLGLNQFMEKAVGSRLVRIHRSYAINVDAVQSFTEQEVRIGKEVLPIGRSYKDDFMRQFGS
jgi:DNA-binding LytR/AlgR family response regulator